LSQQEEEILTAMSYCLPA